MESRAPVSSVVRARPRSWGGVLGVGRRALRWRSWRLAVERREAIFCGEGEGVDWSCVRVVVRSVVDILGIVVGVCERVRSCFGRVLPMAEAFLADAVERMERSAIITGRKPARSAAERSPNRVIRGPKALGLYC